MKPEQALLILDNATNPCNVGKLNRIDYINIQSALEALQKFVNENKPTDDKPGSHS